MTSPTAPRPAVGDGLPQRSAREVTRLTVALLLTAAVADLLLTERLSLLFDLVFVSLCVGGALVVRHGERLGIALLPPLSMAGVVLLLAISRPEAIADADDGVVQATATGLSGHGAALALGYGTCAALMALRRPQE